MEEEKTKFGCERLVSPNSVFHSPRSTIQKTSAKDQRLGKEPKDGNWKDRIQKFGYKNIGILLFAFRRIDGPENFCRISTVSKMRRKVETGKWKMQDLIMKSRDPAFRIPLPATRNLDLRSTVRKASR